MRSIFVLLGIFSVSACLQGCGKPDRTPQELADWHGSTADEEPSDTRKNCRGNRCERNSPDRLYDNSTRDDS